MMTNLYEFTGYKEESPMKKRRRQRMAIIFFTVFYTLFLNNSLFFDGFQPRVSSERKEIFQFSFDIQRVEKNSFQR